MVPRQLVCVCSDARALSRLRLFSLKQESEESTTSFSQNQKLNVEHSKEIKLDLVEKLCVASRAPQKEAFGMLH